MAEVTSRSPPRASTFRSDFDFTTLITLAGMTAVLFLGGLGITEAIGEIPLDIDWKPFFIIYAIIYFVPWGTPTVAVAVGGGLGEAIGDAALLGGAIAVLVTAASARFGLWQPPTFLPV